MVLGMPRRLNPTKPTTPSAPSAPKQQANLDFSQTPPSPKPPLQAAPPKPPFQAGNRLLNPAMAKTLPNADVKPRTTNSPPVSNQQKRLYPKSKNYYEILEWVSGGAFPDSEDHQKAIDIFIENLAKTEEDESLAPKLR